MNKPQYKQNMQSKEEALPEKKLSGLCPMRYEFQDEKMTGVGVCSAFYNKEDPHGAALQRLTSTRDKELASEIVERGARAMPQDRSLEHNYNEVVQCLAADQPKDAMESRLCLQANALYAQGMQYLHRAENSDMMCHQEHYMKFALKILRLHNETIEALNRYRRGGEQKVVVQHVNVNEGAQAAFMAGNFKAEARGGG